jgi:hypothetical protein
MVSFTLFILSRLPDSPSVISAQLHLDRAERKNDKLLNPVVLFLVQDLRSKLPPT